MVKFSLGRVRQNKIHSKIQQADELLRLAMSLEEPSRPLSLEEDGGGGSAITVCQLFAVQVMYLVSTVRPATVYSFFSAYYRWAKVHSPL